MFLLRGLRVVSRRRLHGYLEQCAVVLVRLNEFEQAETLGDNVTLQIVALLLGSEFGLFFVLVAWRDHRKAFNIFDRGRSSLLVGALDGVGISLDSLILTKIAFLRSGLRSYLICLVVLDLLFHALDNVVLQLQPIFGRKLLVQVRHLEHRSLHIDEVDISQRLGRRPGP